MRCSGQGEETSSRAGKEVLRLQLSEIGNAGFQCSVIDRNEIEKRGGEHHQKQRNGSRISGMNMCVKLYMFEFH